jgi:predicted enzyme related to lactoylglutathione lyase
VVEGDSERSLWLPYVEVEDVRAATEGARQLGAEVPLEPREGPAGWRSVIATAAGGDVALWQPKR